MMDRWGVSVQALQDLTIPEISCVTPTGKVVCVWKEMFQVILSLQALKTPMNEEFALDCSFFFTVHENPFVWRASANSP